MVSQSVGRSDTFFAYFGSEQITSKEIVTKPNHRHRRHRGHCWPVVGCWWCGSKGKAKTTTNAQGVVLCIVETETVIMSLGLNSLRLFYRVFNARLGLPLLWHHNHGHFSFFSLQFSWRAMSSPVADPVVVIAILVAVAAKYTKYDIKSREQKLWSFSPIPLRTTVLR